MAKTYQQKKEAARQMAIDWQIEFQDRSMYQSELQEAGDRFEKVGRRYGLLQEFRENGIPC